MAFDISITVLAVVVAAVSAVVLINHRQQRRITRANQVSAGRPTLAPPSWALSHDPEARLHRRLRDAVAALATVSTVETGTSLILRVDLEQGAADLDDHLVAISRLPPADRAARLQTAAAAVECIEAGVAHYVAAALPAPAAPQAELGAAQRQLDAAGDLRNRLDR